mmetsp:Transcript_98851/g.276828  ORF Transcript_98851/g.276828 Transcript_98851/m.276828 type:complete len:371 (+) Transcript_98851:76-1188(+)
MASRQCQGSPLALLAAGAVAFEEKLWFEAGVRVAGLGLLLITLSTLLIATNGHLMSHHRFPFPASVIFLNMCFCSSVAGALRVSLPSLFPSLTDMERGSEIGPRLVFQTVLPICLFSTMSLVCSNFVYEFLSIAFMQMVKETGIVVVFVLSIVLGTEHFSWARFQTVILAVGFAFLSVHGEMNFSSTGFALQVLGIIFESLRVASLGALLQGKRWDVMTYMLVFSPVSATLIGCTVAFSHLLPFVAVPSFLEIPTSAAIHEHWPLLLASCCLSFGLQVVVAVLIKRSSAMTYMFCQLIKDVVAVLMSAFLLHEGLSTLQCVSFSLQLATVATWSIIGMYPVAFRGRGLFSGLAALASSAMAKPTDPLHTA